MMLLVLFSDKKLSKFGEDLLSALQAQTTATTEGFEKVANAISDLKNPVPPPDDQIAVKGEIRMRYLLNEDEVAKNPGPKTDTISCGGLTSKAGTPVKATDIDLTVKSSSPNVSVSISNQRLSDDEMSVLADVTREGAASQPNTELAVVTYEATNRDTGKLVAADIDEFVTGPGEADFGTIDSPISGMTPVDETPAPPAAPVE